MLDSGSGAKTPLAPSKREAQIPHQLNHTSNALDKLLSTISELEDCLQPVMRSPEPQTTDEHKEPGELAPLAGDIRGIRSTISQHTRRLESIIDRLEL